MAGKALPGMSDNFVSNTMRACEAVVSDGYHRSPLGRVNMTAEEVREAMLRHQPMPKVIPIIRQREAVPSSIRPVDADRELMDAIEVFLRTHGMATSVALAEFTGVGPHAVGGAIGRMRRAGVPIDIEQIVSTEPVLYTWQGGQS